MNNLIINIEKCEVEFDGKKILNIKNLKVYENEKIGIIGANGSGKSTLVKLMTGEITPSKGTVTTLDDFTYFAQMDDLDESSIIEINDEILRHFTVPDNNYQSMSGGQKAKYRLATIFSTYQQGMILDEPTTHLDQVSKEVLIEELTYYYGTLICVSHDRHFLDKVVDKILEVKNGEVKEYSGNFTAYVEQKKQEEMRARKKYEHYQNKKQVLNESLIEKKKQAQRANKVTAKQKNRAIKPDRLSSSKQKDTIQKNLNKQAKSIMSRIDKLEKVDKADVPIKLAFPTSKNVEIHNKFPIIIDNLTVNYDGKDVLKSINYQVPLNKKIAILGDNGSGKTTFLTQIINKHPEIYYSPKIKMVMYKQLAYQLKSQQPLLSYLMEKTEYPEKIIRSILNRLGFSESSCHTSLDKLSGGEATKVSIAEVFIKPSNLIILDEPTNFIDIETIAALEDFINAYTGTILYTSHDDYFIKNTANEMIQIVDGELTRQ